MKTFHDIPVQGMRREAFRTDQINWRSDRDEPRAFRNWSRSHENRARITKQGKRVRTAPPHKIPSI